MAAFWGLLGFDALVLATAATLGACGIGTCTVKRPTAAQRAAAKAAKGATP